MVAADPTLAEILAEVERQAANYTTVILPIGDAKRLAAAARAAQKLFAALDYVTPGWREDTCVLHGDDVNVAWYELERTLGQGPDAAAGGRE